MTMKLLMESWRRYLNELLIHGDKNEAKYVLAYGKDMWLLSDYDIPEDVQNHIEKTLGVEVGEFTRDLQELGDYRADILYGDISDNTLWLSSSGSYQFDPKASVLVKRVVDALGLSGVSYTTAGSDEDVETSKYAIEGKIPDIAYHGTSTEYAPAILKVGLKPGESRTNYEAISHHDRIFFTTRFDEAWHHALHTSGKVGGDPMVIEHGIPDKNLLVPDYDVDVGSENTCYDYICAKTRENQKKFGQQMKGKSFSLSREFGIFGYKGRIPANHIESYHVLMNAEDNYGDDKYYLERDQITEMTRDELKIYLETKAEYGIGQTEYPEYDDEEESEW
jgi:hypothetical protein